MTAKGQPDVASRLFLKKLKTTLNLPVLGLVDSDPYGVSPAPHALVAPLPCMRRTAVWPCCRLEDLVRVHEWLQEHELRQRVPDHAGHQVVGCAPVRPQQVQGAPAHSPCAHITSAFQFVLASVYTPLCRQSLLAYVNMLRLLRCCACADPGALPPAHDAEGH